MEMSIKDVTVIGIDASDNSLHIGAAQGTVGMTWPPTLMHDGTLYVYKCNEVLTDDLLRFFGGHAKYTRNIPSC